MDDLTKDALLTRLRAWHHVYQEESCIAPMDNQAHTQLVKIVEGYFSEPVQVDEPSGAMPGEYMHEWVEKDAVLFDLPAEEIIEAMARDNKLLHYKLKGLTQKRRVSYDEVLEMLSDIRMEIKDSEDVMEWLNELGMGVEDEEEEQPPMDRETAGDMKYHELKDEDRLDPFGRRK